MNIRYEIFHQSLRHFRSFSLSRHSTRFIPCFKQSIGQYSSRTLSHTASYRIESYGGNNARPHNHDSRLPSDGPFTIKPSSSASPPLIPFYRSVPSDDWRARPLRIARPSGTKENYLKRRVFSKIDAHINSPRIAAHLELNSQLPKSSSSRIQSPKLRHWRWLSLVSRSRQILHGNVLDIRSTKVNRPLQEKYAELVLRNHHRRQWLGHLLKTANDQRSGSQDKLARSNLKSHKRTWQRVMLWAIVRQPYQALRILDATVSYSITTRSTFLVDKILLPLVIRLLKDRSKQRRHIVGTFHRIICKCAEGAFFQMEKAQSASVMIIRTILDCCDSTQVAALYKAVCSSNPQIHLTILKRFHWRMAYRFESPDLVLDLLRRLSTSGSDMENFRIQRTCIKILRNHSDDPDWYKTTLNYQAQMLEIGIRPQQIMLNAMIMNAVEAEDFETAYSIFDVAKSRRIRRGTVMYSVIFKGVAQSLNHNILEGLILRAEEEGALPRNNPLVFCLLVTVWKLLHRGRKLGSQYPQVYTAMLQVYARYCDVFPLQELGIYMPEKSKRVEPISKPTPQILCIMLLGFMAQHSNSNHLLDLYMRYHSLVKQNHPLITPIAQTDHVANAFVLHLGRNIRTLSACPMILRNMLEPPVTANIKVAEPSVQTWSILAFSYSIQGQKSAAERVLAMMRERGYRPNGVTWNSIINGYAKCQDIKAVVEAMRQMTSAGFEVNSRILRALTHVVDQKGLLSSLRKVINIDQIYEREFDPKDKQSELVTSKVLGNGSEVIQYAVKKKQRQIRDNEATIKLQEGAYD